MRAPGLPLADRERFNPEPRSAADMAALLRLGFARAIRRASTSWSQSVVIKPWGEPALTRGRRLLLHWWMRGLEEHAENVGQVKALTSVLKSVDAKLLELGSTLDEVTEVLKTEEHS